MVGCTVGWLSCITLENPMIERADALQWAIDQIDAIKNRNDRTQEERNYLHEMEELRDAYAGPRHRAFKKPT